jgi:hypothetical protein
MMYFIHFRCALPLCVRFACVVVAVLSGLFAPLRAQVPQLINYQGRVAVGGVNFSGSGSFQFALVNTNGTATYWSNDGTSAAGSEPTSAVAIPVTNGLYSVLLGDTSLANMTAIPASVWTNPDVRLRVWFNDGTNGFQLLTPDQRLATNGYLPAGAVTSAAIASGAVTSAQLAPGAVGSLQIASGAVGNTQLAPSLTLTGNNNVSLANPSWQNYLGTSPQALNYQTLQQALFQANESDFIIGINIWGDGGSTGSGSWSTDLGSDIRLDTGANSNSGNGSLATTYTQNGLGCAFAPPGFGHAGQIYFGQPGGVRFKFAFASPLTPHGWFGMVLGSSGKTLPAILNGPGVAFAVQYNNSTIGNLVINVYDSALRSSPVVATIDTSGNYLIHEVIIEWDGSGNFTPIVDGAPGNTLATALNFEVAGGPVLQGLLSNGATLWITRCCFSRFAPASSKSLEPASSRPPSGPVLLETVTQTPMEDFLSTKCGRHSRRRSREYQLVWCRISGTVVRPR